MTVRLIEVRPRAAGHQLALQVAILYQCDFLGANALIVHGVSADQRGAVEILCARIIHHRHTGRQNSSAKPPHPIALSTQVGEKLLHHRRERYRWAGSVQCRSQHLGKNRRSSSRLEEDGTGIVLRRRRGSQGHQFGACDIQSFAHRFDVRQIGRTRRVRRVKMIQRHAIVGQRAHPGLDRSEPAILPDFGSLAGQQVFRCINQVIRHA